MDEDGEVDKELLADSLYYEAIDLLESSNEEVTDAAVTVAWACDTPQEFLAPLQKATTLLKSRVSVLRTLIQKVMKGGLNAITKEVYQEDAPEDS